MSNIPYVTFKTRTGKHKS